MLKTFINIILNSIKNKKNEKASITVEASISFTLMIFIIFTLLGPLLIIKTSTELMIDLNNDSKKRCYYEIIKTGLDDLVITEKIKKAINENEFLNKHFDKIEDVANSTLMLAELYNKHLSRGENIYNIAFVMDMGIGNDIYDEETGIVKYDYLFFFKLPYNVLNTKEINMRLINNRRAFIGAGEDRFSDKTNSGGYYIANNHTKSSAYHLSPNCSYFSKDTKSVSINTIDAERNEDGEKYTKCKYCIGDKKNLDLSNVYITKLGNKYHINKDCPLMTALVVKEVSEEYVIKMGLHWCNRRCTR